MLFGAGKRNRIENNENESWLTSLKKTVAVLQRSIPVLPIQQQKQDVLLTFACHYIPHHNMTTTRHTSFSLEQPLIFLSCHPLLSGGVPTKNSVTHTL